MHSHWHGKAGVQIKIPVSFDNVSVACQILIKFLMKYDMCQAFHTHSASPCLVDLELAKPAELIENNPDFAARAHSASPCLQQARWDSTGPWVGKAC